MENLTRYCNQSLFQKQSHLKPTAFNSFRHLHPLGESIYLTIDYDSLLYIQQIPYFSYTEKVKICTNYRPPFVLVYSY